MEQHNQEIGTRRDLVLYRLETARNDLKSARALFSIENCAEKDLRSVKTVHFIIPSLRRKHSKINSFKLIFF